MAYMVGVAACLAAFYFTPAAWPAVQWLTVFLIGFFLYGPQMLIGLCGAELVRACLLQSVYSRTCASCAQSRRTPGEPLGAHLTSRVCAVHAAVLQS